jgi:hypothetical protein
MYRANERKVEEFKRLCAQVMDIVRAKDVGTHQYVIYLNDDQPRASSTSDTKTPRRSSSTPRTLAIS